MITVFDLETTGLSGAYCDVIQFSYVQLEDDGKFVKADTMYFYHKGMHWDQEVCDNVHHITLEFLEQFEEQFEENLIKMYTVLFKADVVGHNSIGFDCPFASQWFQRMGLAGLVFGSIKDTMKIYQPVTKTARVKLTKLCDMHGLTPEKIRGFEKDMFGSLTTSHNANYDATATALLVMNAIKKGMVQFGDTPVARVDVSGRKVCEGFYVQTTSGMFCVDGDGVRSVANAPKELIIPMRMRATGPMTFEAMYGSSGIKMDIGSGVCKLFTNGAELNTMNLTMPYTSFVELLWSLSTAK